MPETHEPRSPRRPDAPRNLAPQRGPSVWDRPEPSMTWSAAESERMCVAACGSALAAMGWRQRSNGGALLAVAGGVLAVRALFGYNDLASFRRLVQRLRLEAPADRIEAASDDSFPASDAPSWTTATAGASVTAP